MVKVNRDLPDGLYFNMPFDVYLAQDAFSTSRVNAVNDSVLTYWRDEIEPTLDPDFDLRAKLDDATEAMAEGTAWHVMALEGVEAFNALYAVGYDAKAFPDALGSKDSHMKAAVKHGVAVNKSDTIPKLRDKLIAGGAPVTFHADHAAAHEAAAAGKTMFAADKMAELQFAGRVMAQYAEADPEVARLLTGGFPEVSILVTIKGVRYKVRVDYLTPTHATEYKTLSRRNKKKPFEQICADQMHDFGYFVNGYLYSICIAAARERMRSNDAGFETSCLGAPDSFEGLPSSDWLQRFQNHTAGEYWFLFQERGKSPHVLPRRFDKYDEALQSRKMQSIWKTGRIDVERAVDLHAWYSDPENCGREKIWLPRIEAKAFSDDDFKPWQIEE